MNHSHQTVLGFNQMLLYEFEIEFLKGRCIDCNSDTCSSKNRTKWAVWGNIASLGFITLCTLKEVGYSLKYSFIKTLKEKFKKILNKF